jgi:MFS transporter, ACS family, D-galactonate transporter
MQQPDHQPRSLRAFVPALVLLVISFLINYVDRGNLSIAAPLLSVELALSPVKLGLLLSAFSWTYTPVQFVMGWLVDHFDVNRILAAGFLIWSLATVTTGVVHGFVLLLVMRLILGIGESVALPAGSKILARCLTEHHRGFAGGTLMSAMRMGNAVGTFGTGFLIAKYGWRPAFIGIGLVSMLWLPAWIKWMPRDGHTDARVRPASVGFMEILKHRSFWGTTVGHFSCNYLFYFMITWLPSYLILSRNLSLTTMTKIAGAYYMVEAASAMLSGWLQDLYIRNGLTCTQVRKAAMAIGFSLGAIGVMGCALAGAQGYVAWLMLAGVGSGMTAPGLFAFCQRIAGPEAVGRWYGPQNGIANFAGIIGPVLTGFVFQKTGNFLWPFAIAAALCIVGIVAWVFVVGKVEPASWSESKPRIAYARV